MADGRKKNGGKRANSGPKSRAEILGLGEIIDSAWSVQEQKDVFKKLAQDCFDDDFHIRHEARKLLIAYKFGKPRESMDITSNGKDLPATFTFKIQSNAPIMEGLEDSE